MNGVTFIINMNELNEFPISSFVICLPNLQTSYLQASDLILKGVNAQKSLLVRCKSMSNHFRLWQNFNISIRNVISRFNIDNLDTTVIFF